MEIRFTVGEMAKLNGITKQMLIFYDRENIFKPKIINPSNGYRYYTADQLEELDSILMLREMGFSLEKIKSHMKNRSGIQTIEILKEQKNEVEEKINHWKMIDKRLQHKIHSIEDFYRCQETDEFIINCEKEYFTILPVEKPYGLLQIDIALKKLITYATKHNYSHFYQIGDMVSCDSLKSKNYLKFEYAFLPLCTPCEEDKLHIKPQGTYAHGYHIGSYQSMGRTYEKLLQKIEQCGYKITGYSYEYCVIDCLSTKLPEEYITEIQIQVEPI